MEKLRLVVLVDMPVGTRHERKVAREFREWLKNEKGIDPQQAFGDLQYVFEYVTEELNDPAIYELPEVPYQAAMDIVRTAM